MLPDQDSSVSALSGSLEVALGARSAGAEDTPDVWLVCVPVELWPVVLELCPAVGCSPSMSSKSLAMRAKTLD